MVGYKYLLYITIILVMFTSCEIIKSKYLENGIAKVPYNNKVFKRKNRNLSSEIDANYIYEQVGSYNVESQLKKIQKTESLGLHYIQFYENGAVRFLYYLEPNPDISGIRGVFYIKNKRMYIDEFGMTSDRSLTIYTYKVKVEGDTIYLLEIMPNTLLFKPSEYICYVYKKSEKIPEEWKKYKPDW